jgi:hypothetical protein
VVATEFSGSQGFGSAVRRGPFLEMGRFLGECGYWEEAESSLKSREQRSIGCKRRNCSPHVSSSPLRNIENPDTITLKKSMTIGIYCCSPMRGVAGTKYITALIFFCPAWLQPKGLLRETYSYLQREIKS